MVAAFVLGPLIWLVALVVGLLLIHRADVIEVGLLITFAAFVVSCAGLLAFYVARRRQELREHRR
jgi:NO-binding membrane sensor protein with MHYT domain